jgi:hypothetical protein
MPAPTMSPTTIAVRAKSDNFCADCEPIALRTEVADNAAQAQAKPLSYFLGYRLI